MKKFLKKLSFFTLVFFSFSTISIFASQNEYWAYTKSTSEGSAFFISDDGEKTVYCYNHDYLPPGSSHEDSTNKTYYTREESYLDTNDELMDKYGKEIKERIAAVLVYGYPLNSGELMDKYGLNEDQARYMTQQLLWDITKGNDYPFNDNNGKYQYYDKLLELSKIKKFEQGDLNLVGKFKFIQINGKYSTDKLYAIGNNSGSFSIINLPENMTVKDWNTHEVLNDKSIKIGQEFYIESTTNPSTDLKLKINYNFQEVKFYFYKHYRGGLFDKTNLYQNLIRAELGNKQIEKQYEISLDGISNVPENGNDNVETPNNGENKPNIPNKNTNVNVIVNKVEKGTNNKVIGAVLSLHEGDSKDGKLIERWTTNNESKKIKLEFGKTYTLVEESAPEGYELANPITFTVGNNNESNSVKIISDTTNYAGYRYNSERYVTNGISKSVIYCFNHDLDNPEVVLNDTLPELTNKNYPHYKKWSLSNVSDEILRENQKENFTRKQIAELLLAGYPTDCYGFKEKYKLTDSEAYSRTQAVLDSVLSGNNKLQNTNGLTDKYLDLANYYNDLVTAYLNPKIEDSVSTIDFFEWIKGSGKQNKTYQHLVGVTNFENNITIEVTMEDARKGIGGTTPNLPGEEGTPQNKLNLNIPKTGDLGTVGFGILGALSLIGLGVLNKSKFK